MGGAGGFITRGVCGPALGLAGLVPVHLLRKQQRSSTFLSGHLLA